jgi:uncharacterized protein
MKALAWVSCQAVVPEAQGSAALRLEARRLPAADGGGAVVAAPHPLYGGTFHNPVVISIADGLARAGISALTFNWRGTEGSEGSKTDSLEAAVADYSAAIDALESSDARPPLYAAGYSFGAATALLAARADRRVAGVIMLAPPVGMLHEVDLKAAPDRLLVVVGSDDEYAPLAALEAKLAARSDVALEVISGADHFFHFGGLSEIAGHIAARIARW